MIGNITELQCMLSFIELGYAVSIPYGSKERYDFVVDINGKLLRIQCKKCTFSYHKKYDVIKFKTSVYSRGKGQLKYKESELDYFCTYYNNNCYLIPYEDCKATSKTLYLNDFSGVKENDLAEKYELKHVLMNLN